MSGRITMKSHAATRQSGTVPFDTRYDSKISLPLIHVMWIDGAGEVRDEVVQTTDTWCAGKRVEQTGGDRYSDDTIYESVDNPGITA